MPALTRLEADPYEHLASAYHLLTARYQHDAWLENLLREVECAGFRVETALDVACGTGLSTRPMVERGIAVTGVDRSNAMLSRARETLGAEVPLVQADMRALPELGGFDLVTCLDDSLNHLLTSAELETALAGMTANLATDGALVFDLNTLPTMQSAFSSDWIAEDEDTIHSPPINRWGRDPHQRGDRFCRLGARRRPLSLMAGEQIIGSPMRSRDFSGRVVRVVRARPGPVEVRIQASIG